MLLGEVCKREKRTQRRKAATKGMNYSQKINMLFNMTSCFPHDHKPMRYVFCGLSKNPVDMDFQQPAICGTTTACP